jgi:flavin-dependent dehydrogenase
VKRSDVVIVGGGPAGSTCAWKLRQAGLDVLVLDLAKFPRTKLCAGWVTPEAIADLELEEGDYPLGFITFETLHLHWKRITVRHRSRQHSIRRYEFDDFLLRRSGAEVVQHKVRDIEQRDGSYLIDDEYECQYLVGAGGTRCPVYRQLFHDLNPRSGHLQTATLEQEFEYEWDNGECHLWFFEEGLPGYSWYVPKANGHINVGLGGMAEQLKRQDAHLRTYWQQFVDMLADNGLASYNDYKPKGYSYYLRGNVDVVRVDNAFIVGDSIGLATVDMCEGIGPAIKSGILAAQAIAEGSDYSLEDLSRYSGGSFVSKLLERKFTGTRRASASRRLRPAY